MNKITETILFAPGARGSELIKSLALYGVDSVGVRVCGGVELAKRSLLSAGVCLEGEFIDRRHETALVSEALDNIENDYFGKVSYKGITELADTLRKMRSLVAGSDEEKELEGRLLDNSTFPGKNQALFSLYKSYMKLIRERGLLDSVSLMRKAISEGQCVGAEIICLEEYPLYPIEKELHRIAKGEGRPPSIASTPSVGDGQCPSPTGDRNPKVNAINAHDVHTNIIAASGKTSNIAFDEHNNKDNIVLNESKNNINKIVGDGQCPSPEMTGEINEINIVTDKVCIKDLFAKRNTAPTPGGIKRVVNCYGAGNEVESIISAIYSEDKSADTLDSCVVAVTDPATYGQLFFDYACLYDIPISFGFGIPIINSNPAGLLKLYLAWKQKPLGPGLLSKMLSSDTFDKKKLEESIGKLPDGCVKTFYEVAGDLKLTDDSGENADKIKAYEEAVKETLKKAVGKKKEEYEKKEAIITYLKKLSKELMQPLEDFIEKYARIRENYPDPTGKMLRALDKKALTEICEGLRALRVTKTGIDEDEYISYLLSVNVAKCGSRPGSLYVTGVADALCSPRNKIFVAGLSSDKYPGSPQEDHLLLDCDLEEFAGGEEYTSENEILKKRASLKSLSELGEVLGSEITFSYAGLDVSELKNKNALSLINELTENQEERSGYFDYNLSVSAPAGKAYTEGKCLIVEKNVSANVTGVAQNPDKVYSPTGIETFFKCPKKFYLKYILKINEPDEEKAFEIISARDIGILAHDLMERLGKASKKPDKKSFLEMAGEAFDIYLKEHPPLIKSGIDKERDDFVRMMDTAYDMKIMGEAEMMEEDIYCTFENSVRLKGVPDRVERLDNGKCVVVDFKTGRNVEHKDNDIDTCLQAVLYAYMLEKNGKEVEECEYRYLRHGKPIKCKYDDGIRNGLADKMKEFKQALDTGEFPVADEEKACKYCTYVQICGVNECVGK